MPFFTINAAAEVLERDRRTIGRALRGVAPDHQDAQGREQWRLATIVKALTASEHATASEDVIEEIEAAGRDVEATLERLRRCDQAEARQLIREGIGACVGRLDRAMEAGAGGLKPHEQQLLAVVRDGVVANLIAEICQLAGWQITGDERH